MRALSHVANGVLAPAITEQSTEFLAVSNVIITEPERRSPIRSTVPFTGDVLL